MNSPPKRHGYIYVIHFRDAFHHARHYIGCCNQLRARLARHAAGHGARLLQVLGEQDRPWELGGVYQCTLTDLRTVERWTKRQKHSSAYCEVCRGQDRRRIAGTLPIDLDLIAWPKDSKSLAKYHRSRARVIIDQSGPCDIRSNDRAAQIEAIMSADRVALGYVPAVSGRGMLDHLRCGRITLAWVGRKVVGYVYHTRRNDVVTIHQVGVIDAYRRQGIATAMIRHLTKHVAGCLMKCRVRADLKGSLMFWTRIGFRRVKTSTHRTSKRVLIHFHKHAKENTCVA